MPFDPSKLRGFTVYCTTILTSFVTTTYESIGPLPSAAERWARLYRVDSKYKLQTKGTLMYTHYPGQGLAGGGGRRLKSMQGVHPEPEAEVHLQVWNND